MARIYIGRSTGIGSFERHVVLKMILPERANDYTAVQMFLDEARLAASLNHQNVAQVFEVGEDGGIHFLAMEYVHGQDLRVRHSVRYCSLIQVQYTAKLPPPIPTKKRPATNVTRASDGR